MLRILDRYVLRELMAPFGLSLLLLTFVLEIPPILQQGEVLIAEGASWDVVVRVLATLLPQALGITIPMALLVGILITLGRLSGDREIVAMEACGVSLGRLLRPLLLFSLAAVPARVMPWWAERALDNRRENLAFMGVAALLAIGALFLAG